MGVECDKPSKPTLNVRFRGFRINTISTVRDAVGDDPRELGAAEYFYQHTLPILVLCRPSIAWHASIKQLAQDSIAVRKILVALGDQHRLADVQASPCAFDDPDLHMKAEASYARAIPSWRRSLAVQSMEEVTVLATGCLLLIIIECFRNDRRVLSMHLTAGVRTINGWAGLARNQKSCISGFTADIIALLDECCDNSASHSAWPMNTKWHTQLPEVARLDQSLLERLPVGDSCGLELSSINRECLRLTHKLWEIPMEFRSPDGISRKQHELWANAKDLLAKLLEERDKQPLASPQYAVEYSAAYASAAINILRLTPPNAFLNGLVSTHAYTLVLDALEPALLAFQHVNNRVQPAPFSIGLNMIHVLSLVAESTDGELCARALDMLTMCPRKECLWDADETLSACRDAQRRRSTSVSDYSDVFSCLEWASPDMSEWSQE